MKTEEKHRSFQIKVAGLKELWKKRLISFNQLYSMYQQAQEAAEYYWEDKEIEEMLTT